MVVMMTHGEHGICQKYMNEIYINARILIKFYIFVPIYKADKLSVCFHQLFGVKVERNKSTQYQFESLRRKHIRQKIPTSVRLHKTDTLVPVVVVKSEKVINLW